MAQHGQPDALLTAGRALLYPGLALTSLLVLRGPAELPLGDILVAAGGLVGAMSIVRSQQRVPGAVLLAGALTAAGGVVASAVSSDPLDSLGIAARLVYMVLVLPWILLTLLTEQRHLVRAVLWWLAGAAACGAYALLQAGAGEMVTGDGRFTGLTTHPSDLGGTTAMAVGAALGAVLSPLARRHRRMAAVVLAVSTVGLLLSGSVSGMLAVIAVVLFLIVQGAIRPRRAVAIGVAVVVAGGVGLFLLDRVGGRNPVERFLFTTSSTAGADTAGIRLDLARRAVDGILQRPLVGHGLAIADNDLLRGFSVHNNLLSAWHSGGILLLAGVLIASAAAVRYCLVRDQSDPLHIAVASSVIAAIAFAQTAPSVYNRYYWVPVAFAVVLAVRASAVRKDLVGPACSER